MKRREFLKTAGYGVLASATLIRAETKSKSAKPNILIIMSDQQFGDGMSCVMGTKYLRTPHMDALAENGTRFTRAYSPNPLCTPMRTSMMLGKYPHQTGVQTNGGRFRKEAGSETIGKIFRDAGYEAAYYGKWHVAFRNSDSFDPYLQRGCVLDAKHAVEFIRRKHDRPFLMIASFLSPHEICEWARKQNLPGGSIGEPPPLDERPPLRENAAPPENETDIMAHMRRSYHATRMTPVGNYTEDDWRRHVWGYYRLIERMDGFVGKVMKALHESGQEEDTVVVFLSDHGDCHGAHLWNQKTVFYDESARVPFIISQKGTTTKRTCDLLLNVGVDMIPTICDFAGIKPPDGLPGKSMKAPALGNSPSWKRDYVVTQNCMAQGASVDGKKLRPHGRMIRSDRYKYCLYGEGERRESLVDMEKDPGEMINQAGNPLFEVALTQHRAFLKEFAERHKDEMALEMLEHLEE